MPIQPPFSNSQDNINWQRAIAARQNFRDFFGGGVPPQPPPVNAIRLYYQAKTNVLEALDQNGNNILSDVLGNAIGGVIEGGTF